MVARSAQQSPPCEKCGKRNEQRRALKNGAGLLANPRQAPVLAQPNVVPAKATCGWFCAAFGGKSCQCTASLPRLFAAFRGQKYHKFGKKANVSIGIDNQVVFLSSSLYTGCRIGSRRHRQAWVQLPKHYLVRECLLFPKIVIYRLLHFHSS